MSPLRLYAVSGCPMAHRAAISLREKSVEFDVEYFEIGKRPSELESLGPRAKSPTLFDGQARVFDSGVVLEYLEDRFPEKPLLPRAPSERAAARLWIIRINEELMPKLGTLYVATTKQDQAAIQAAGRAIDEQLASWDVVLRAQAFLAGNELTIADIALYTPFAAHKANGTYEPARELAGFRGWMDRMAARPSSARLIK